MQRIVSRERPKKYTPTQVERVAAYCLTKQMTSLFDIAPEYQDEPWLRMQRADGAYINYFGTVKDINDTAYPYSTAEEWFTRYMNKINRGHVSPADITLAPLVLVKNNRRHFNTILITGVDGEHKKLSFYILEPKSHNEYIKFKLFPTVYPVLDLLYQLCAVFKNYSTGDIAIDVSQKRLGIQGIINNTDCGAHHINVADAVSKLSMDEILNEEKLITALKSTSIKDRNDDGTILDSLNDCEDTLSICKKYLAENNIPVIQAASAPKHIL